MAAGLAQVFEARKLVMARRGWPTPPGQAHQVSHMKAWLDYWRAVELLFERNGWQVKAS